MGHGIAQVAAQGGMNVAVVETEQKFLDSGLARIDKSLAKLSERAKEKGGTFDAAGIRKRISGSLDRKTLADCDLVIEAIVENLDAKNQLFAELGKLCKKDAIFASNTSSFPIAAMAQASGRPRQFVGLHFFNPVQLMKLVEVARTNDTSDEVFAAARAFGEACGKTPVACKDTPGFIVNRLLVPYLVQSLNLLERGDATASDIDTAMKLGGGHPLEAIELTDYVRIGTRLSILEGWVRAYPKETAFSVPSILKKKVAEKKLGRKSGEGFYKWEGDKKVS
jgi:3-hydroxyacyl-CoA dehydrogenase